QLTVHTADLLRALAVAPHSNGRRSASPTIITRSVSDGWRTMHVESLAYASSYDCRSTFGACRRNGTKNANFVEGLRHVRRAKVAGLGLFTTAVLTTHNKGEMRWRSTPRTRFAFGTIAMPRRRRGFMPKPF